MSTTEKNVTEEELPSSGLPARGFSDFVYDSTRWPKSRIYGSLAFLVLAVAFLWIPLLAFFLFLAWLILYGPAYKQEFVYQHLGAWLGSALVRRKDGMLYATDFRTPPSLEKRPFDAEIAYVGIRDTDGGQVVPVISPKDGRQDVFYVFLQTGPTARDVEAERTRFATTINRPERAVAWMDGDDRAEWNMAFMGFIQTILDFHGVIDVSWSSIKLPADPYDNMNYLGHRVELGDNMSVVMDPQVAEQWINIMAAHELTHATTLDTIQVLTVRVDRKRAWHNGVRPDVSDVESRSSQPFMKLYASITNRAGQLGFDAVIPAPHELPMVIKAFLDPAQAKNTYRRFFSDVRHLHAEVSAGGNRMSVLETDTVRLGPWVDEVQADVNMVRLGSSWHVTFRVEHFGFRKIEPSFFNGMVQFGDDIGWVSHTVHAAPSNGKVVSWFNLQRRNAKRIRSEQQELASPELHLDAAKEHQQLFETAASSGRWATFSFLVHVSARNPDDLERIADAVNQMYEVQGITLSRVIPELRQVPAVLQCIGINVE